MGCIYIYIFKHIHVCMSVCWCVLACMLWIQNNLQLHFDPVALRNANSMGPVCPCPTQCLRVSLCACACESVEPSWMCVFMGQAVGGGR